MKRLNLKSRIQIEFFKGFLLGTFIIGLAVPIAVGSEQIKGETINIGSLLDYLPFGRTVKIVINGDVIALAQNEKIARQAFKEARFQKNAEAKGLTLLDMDIAYEEKQKKDDTTKGMKIQNGRALTQTIYNSLEVYSTERKTLAYTIKVNNYTVTLGSKEEVVNVLEKVQKQYDKENAFSVILAKDADSDMEQYVTTVMSKEDLIPFSDEKEAIAVSVQIEDTSNELEEDGVKDMQFGEKIIVTESFVEESCLSNVEEALEEITAENEEPKRYEVQSGDCLSVIAENHDMTTKELKELNADIENDDNIRAGDEITVMIPKTEVNVLVEEQETYTENYEKDIVYEDTSDLYIGETVVIAEGEEGEHTVTALITYKNGEEIERQILDEIIHKEAVAQVVRRGTRARPTYIRPITNGVFTSGFGPRWGSFHAGVDWGVATGTAVMASRGGRIITAGWLGGYGNCVMIDHGDGVVTVYGHLSSVLVSVGTYVDQGGKIALSGNTGRSTGPHLHFEIRVGGAAVDPLPYLQ